MTYLQVMKESKASSDWIAARERYIALNAALRDADKRISEAEKALKASEAEHEATEAASSSAIAEQERVVALTKKGYGKLLDTYGPIEVYEWWIKVPGGGGPSKGARALVSRVGAVTTYNTVEVNVKKKGGLGGAAVGGLLLGPVGAVAGYAVRRKTDVKTTNTPHTEDTREELVQISGKGFAYTTSFSGWGIGTSLANSINRQSSVKTLAKKELPSRVAALARLEKEQSAGRKAGKSTINRANRAIEAAWQNRADSYANALSAWKRYQAIRPPLPMQVAATVIPGIENRAFRFIAPILLVVSLAAVLYSARGTAPSMNVADWVALVAFISFLFVLIDARQLSPNEKIRKG